MASYLIVVEVLTKYSGKGGGVAAPESVTNFGKMHLRIAAAR